ncbi:hypothetical protein ABK040_004679 [Willaertia magna]
MEDKSIVDKEALNKLNKQQEQLGIAKGVKDTNFDQNASYYSHKAPLDDMDVIDSSSMNEMQDFQMPPVTRMRENK